MIGNSGFTLFMVFTTVQDTLLSLQAVDQLTNDFTARIHLLVPDNVRQSTILITPMMLADFTVRYFLTVMPHAVDAQIKLTRYPACTKDLWEIVPPNSLIVLAGSAHRFWPSPEQRFAHRLRHAGHEVIFFSTNSLGTGSSVRFHAEINPRKKKSLFDHLKLFFGLSGISRNQSER